MQFDIRQSLEPNNLEKQKAAHQIVVLDGNVLLQNRAKPFGLQIQTGVLFGLLEWLGWKNLLEPSKKTYFR